MKNKSLLRGLFLALCVTTIGWSFSFITNSRTGLPIKWPPGNVLFLTSLGNAQTLSDGGTYNSSLQISMDIWNAQLGSLQLRSQSSSAGPGNGNNVNEIAFSSTVFGTAFEANVLAVTTTWASGNERSEADILFNSARSWDSYRGPTRGGSVDIRRVAIHELGHALGMDHPDEEGQSVSAIMNSRVSNIDTITADDIAGAQRLYGPPGIPANDNFASATTLTHSSGSLQASGFNTNATRQPGEPLHANNTGGRSVWWRWTAPASGPVTVNTQGSVFDTTLGVYTGAAVSALSTIVSSDDVQDGVIQYSTVTFTASAATTYFFAIDGFDADAGAITLNLSFTPASPTITAQPASQSVNLGGTASFSVTATGGGLTYQWSFNGSALSGATASALTLTNVQPSQAGNYAVTVSNGFGSATSSPATLAVLTPPADQTVTTGRSVTFTAGTGGSFQWQISTNGGSTWVSLTDNATYAGASTASLTINNASTAISGARFRVLSTAGSVVTASSSFTLTVAPAFFPNPTGLASDSTGNLVVADASQNTLQKISLTGLVSAFAGTSSQAGSANGTAAAARFNQPSGLALASTGVLHASDTGNATIRRIATDAAVTTFAGAAGSRGNADATGTNATFSSPVGLAFDAAGNLYVADKMNHTLRRITSAGVTSTFAGAAGVSGTANGAATATARFNNPSGVAVDSSGNLYVADTFNHTIRKISTLGIVTTFAGVELSSGTANGTGSAALFNNPTGLAIDPAGNLYVADTASSTIRKITPAGAVTTFAGLPTISGLKDGTGTDAWFNQPQALAFDGAGNLYVADTGNATIRKITPAGIVTTLPLDDGSPPITPSNPSTPPTPSPPAAASGGGGGGGAPSHFFFAALALLAALRASRRAKR